MEVAFDGATEAVVAASANVVPLRLVQTINTFAFAPPSPDPSGIFYSPPLNRFIDADGEVDETVAGVTYFAGANLFELACNVSNVDI
jgi:hypothetical protein